VDFVEVTKPDPNDDKDGDLSFMNTGHEDVSYLLCPRGSVQASIASLVTIRDPINLRKNVGRTQLNLSDYAMGIC
jgi:hypothetical protein